MPKDEKVGELSETELRALVPRLRHLSEQYRRSELIQKALYHISELSSSANNYENLFSEIHKIVAGFMPADNFFVAFYEQQEEKIQFAYFVDELDEDMVQTIPYEKVKNGITAHILRSGQNLVATQENFHILQKQHGFQVVGTPPIDLMGVPIIREDKVIGAMVVQSYTENIRYDADDLEILVFISQHIVTARDRVIQRDLTETIIEDRTRQLVQANKTLETEISERTRIQNLQSALFEISELSSNAENDMMSFYAQVHNVLKLQIQAKNCYIALLDQDSEMLTFPYFVGRNEDYHAPRRLTHGLTEYVIRTREASLVGKEKVVELVEQGEIDRKFVVRMIEHGNSWMGAPLVVDNEIMGMMAVQTYGEGNDYTPNDLELLRFVSRHIASAIQRRDTANKLLKYNQQLSNKVLERTAELNKSNQSLKRQIEQRKEVELKLIYDAHHDGLTNLPNRVMFNSRLELAIASKARYGEHNFAVLFIDLDRFKTINDTLGHCVGDEFLIEVSKRISACKRSHDLLARLGGDEFVVLVDNFQDIEDVETIAQRIVESVSTPFIIDDNQVFSGASIGIANITQEYAQADEVLRDADAAMYQAKSLGRNRYVMFTPSMRQQLMTKIDDEQAFREAYQNGEFKYSIDPICSLQGAENLYYECNIYWQKDNVVLEPRDFWQLADKCGLNFTINADLLKHVIQLIDTWRDNPKLKHRKVGLNLCIEYLLHNRSLDDLLISLSSSEVDSERLVILLSEQDLYRFNHFLPDVLQKLQNAGVTIILNNFASEYASLIHLYEYHFDYIRLNDRLVNTFSMSDKFYQLLQGIVSLANEMEIGVIASGVDDEMTKQELSDIGCHFAQGLYFPSSDA